MLAILVHGMGRTPASQMLLGRRLRRAGIRVSLFGYSTLQPFSRTVSRLAARARDFAGDDPFVLVGHSLGCVLIRAVVPRLQKGPAACFFLAPPSKVVKAARFFAPNRLYRLLTGDAGRLLADERFMAELPVPEMPVRIYAGAAGPRGPLSPFRHEENDGILAVSETLLPGSHATVVKVPSVHTFIMNSTFVANDIVEAVERLEKKARAPFPTG